MNTTITYEFPLNERIRVFIRLEQLFQQFTHFSAGATATDKRAALSVLQDITMIFKRNDLKSEVLKELDRIAKTLTNTPDEQTPAVLLELTHMSKKLYEIKGKIGAQVMQSDLFQSIAQRSTIPGGTCSFDLPEYHYWLEQDEDIRLKNLQQWSNPFDDIRIAIQFILDLIRNSNLSSQEVAAAGFFQIALDKNQSYQMLRVTIDKSIHCFTEISGGKHRCSVRFMLPSVDDVRPVQSTDNIPFTLTCCLL
ncbi:MAG: cell division protein ZapD [Methylococcales bacterium]|nr:cell division protein ZapD [Methylococcales bacterium]